MTTTAVRGERRHILRSQKGMATVEAVPLLVLFVMLTGFALGFWGAVHSAILQSIASRTYAFETFSNRANLMVHRVNSTRSSSNFLSMRKKGIRYHSIKSEVARTGSDEWKVTTRPLAIGYTSPTLRVPASTHLVKIFDLQPRNEAIDVGPIWITVGYGMCLNSACGR